jgi:hypothetical protein
MYRFLGIMIIILSMTMVSHAQVFTYSRATMHYNVKTVNAALFQQYYWAEDLMHIYRFDYPVYKDRLLLGITRSHFWGWTGFQLRNGDASAGHGSAYTRMIRYGLYAKYKILDYGGIFIITPYVQLDYESSSAKDGVSIAQIFEKGDRIDFEGVVSVETIKMSQILPSVGISGSLKLFWRVYLTGEMYWSFGHTAHQKMYFDYTYKGDPQPRGEWESDGSGWIRSVGISIILWDKK